MNLGIIGFMGQPWKKSLEKIAMITCIYTTVIKIWKIYELFHTLPQPQAHFTPGIITKQCWASQDKTPELDA